ncbi:MAG: flagellar motor switch protein FliG [Treponema sp.]|jgi:flagellar motor switch protein FliG|nr:flagellar motor switch protein FliG [Treponema sp.]
MASIVRQGIKAYRQTIDQKPEGSNGFFETAQTEKNGDKAGKFYKVPEREEKKPDSKYRRVAKFLILIGREHAPEILSKLDPQQIEDISREIATIKAIGAEEGKEILAEFKALFSVPYGLSGFSKGGIETARSILHTAMGAEKGEALLNKAVPDSRENIFGFLEEFSPDQLVLLLKTESVRTAALILSRLPAKITAAAISKMPPGQKSDILMRIAHQSKISPEVLEKVAEALKEKARHISGRERDFEIDGMKTLAAILKQGEYSFGDRILSELEDSDPDIGKDLKDSLYTLEDVVYMIDRPLREKLNTMTEREIAVLLKGRKKDFYEKIMSCVSAGRRALIREEGDIIGPLPKRDCDNAAREFLSWFRVARENGDIILTSDEDVFL